MHILLYSEHAFPGRAALWRMLLRDMIIFGDILKILMRRYILRISMSRVLADRGSWGYYINIDGVMIHWLESIIHSEERSASTNPDLTRIVSQYGKHFFASSNLTPRLKLQLMFRKLRLLIGNNRSRQTSQQRQTNPGTCPVAVG